MAHETCVWGRCHHMVWVAWKLRGAHAGQEARVGVLDSPHSCLGGPPMGLTSGWELVLSRWEPPCRRPHGAGLEEARDGRAHCPPSPGSPDPSGRTAACSVSLQTKAGPLPFRPWALSLDGALAFTGLQPGQRDSPLPRAGVTTVTRRWGLSTEEARGVPGPGPGAAQRSPPWHRQTLRPRQQSRPRSWHS